MSAASDLIEKMEKETGQRWDAEGSTALSGIIGALTRMMGKSNHDERDDVIAGTVLQHQMSPEYKREQESKAMLANLLRAGLSPDDIKALTED